jgi:hypothetical protein
MSQEVNGVLIPDAEERKMMARKRSKNQFAPPACRKCRRGLRDLSVPERYRHFAEQFTLAVEVTLKTFDGGALKVWECPFCSHRQGRHLSW